MDNPTSQKVLGLEGLKILDFPVEEQKLFGEQGQQINGYGVVVRKDNGLPMGVVRKNYKLVSHLEALEPVVSKFTDDGWDVKHVSLEKSGAKAFVELINKNGMVPVKVGDMVGKRLTLLNSYDGSTAIRAEIGSFRLVCLNGLVKPSSPSKGHSLRHAGGVFERLEELGVEFEDEFQQMFQAYQFMTDKLVPLEIAQKVIDSVIGKRKSELILNLWETGIGSDGRRTAWNLYNAVTEYLTHQFNGNHGNATAKNRRAVDMILGQLN